MLSNMLCNMNQSLKKEGYICLMKLYVVILPSACHEERVGVEISSLAVFLNYKKHKTFTPL